MSARGKEYLGQLYHGDLNFTLKACQLSLACNPSPHLQMIEAEVPLNDDGTAFLPFSIRMLLQYNILDKLEQIQTVCKG